jgi:outer membrane murein-binding lipoprotein Lpp
MTASWAPVIEGLASGGVFTAGFQAVRAWLGRGKTRVDQAQVVQGMAIDLITPYKERVTEINAEVDELHDVVDELRKKIRALMDQLDATMDRARRAEDELLKHGIPIPWSRQWTETNGAS